MEPLFFERQHFRQTWLWLLFGVVSIPIVVVLGLGLYQQLVMGRPFGNNPVSDRGLIALFAAVLVIHGGVIGLAWKARLDVTLSSDRLTYRFIPFHFSDRHIPVSSIAEADARHYQPIREYGGWGIRYGSGGRAYNVSGDEGVQLTLRNGKRILFGSQRARELESALRRVMTG